MKPQKRKPASGVTYSGSRPNSGGNRRQKTIPLLNLSANRRALIDGNKHFINFRDQCLGLKHPVHRVLFGNLREWIPRIGLPGFRVGISINCWAGSMASSEGTRSAGAPRERGPPVAQSVCFGVFSMTFCRSRRRQVVEMRCCHVFCWPHNPKVSGSNPPPATNLPNPLQPFGKSFLTPLNPSCLWVLRNRRS